MTQDKTSDSKVSPTAEEIPIDVKLLLCQLVFDAKDGSPWHDIHQKYVNHPIITRLHNKETDYITNISEENIPVLVISIINSTVSPSDVAENHANSSKRTSRSRRSTNPPSHATGANAEKIIELNTCDLDYFHTIGKEHLSLCIFKLHKGAVAEIKEKLSNNRQLFARLLT